MAPATWCTAVVAGAHGTGRGPRRCSSRQLLWSRVLSQWETVFWAVVAAGQDRVDSAWQFVADRVQAGGQAIVSETRATPLAEQVRADQVCAAAAALVGHLAPGVRRGLSRPASADALS